MKHIVALLLIIALAGITSATSLNFQNPTDYTSVITANGSSPAISIAGASWVRSSLATNNYVLISAARDVGGCLQGDQGQWAGYKLPNPAATTYAAATYLGTSGSCTAGISPDVILLDSNGNLLWNSNYINQGYPSGVASGSRIELKMSDGTPYIYDDNVLLKTGPVLSSNPSQVVFGSNCICGAGNNVYWDDMVFGQAENKYIAGIPESDNGTFIILQDAINNANNGVAFGDNGTQVQATDLYGTWGRGNMTIGAEPFPNETVQLINFASGTVYDQIYTGNASAGTFAFNIKTKLIDINAPDGPYAVYMPGHAAYSNIIWKKSTGASVAWSSKHYNVADTGSVITVISTGGYFDTSLYTYKLAVMDVFGIYHGANTTITTQMATVTHTWNPETDNPGVYYAVMYATRISDGQEYIFGYDWTDLSDNAGYAGYVVNGQTGDPISGASVNWTQDGTTSNGTSLADGTYNVTGFQTGMVIHLDVHATGFNPYNYSWTPLAARTVNNLNISMEPTLPNYTGLAIGGVARDSTAYGKPIVGADITVRNLTTGENYIKLTNNWGWYLCDVGASCSFQAATHYDVWGHKIGFDNSTVYNVLTGGL